jgi:PhnB protein
MARKRDSRPSAGGSTRKAGRSAGRSAAAKSARKSRKAGTSRRQRGKRGVELASRVTRTAKKVLFGTLGVAGYVSDVARQRARGGTQAGGRVKPVPDGYHTVTPYLVVRDVPRLIDFVAQAFGATELKRAARPDGSIMHAEVAIGDSKVMMGEPMPPAPPMPGCLHLYVVDTDALYHLALQAGATSLREPTDQFYGDRMAGVQDPAGNQWWIATHTEDVPAAELARRAARANGT